MCGSCDGAVADVDNEFPASSSGVINQGEQPSPYGLGRESLRGNRKGGV